MKFGLGGAGSVGIGSPEPPIGSDHEHYGVGVLLVSGGAGIAPVSVVERFEIGLVEAVLYPDRSFHGDVPALPVDVGGHTQGGAAGPQSVANLHGTLLGDEPDLAIDEHEVDRNRVHGPVSRNGREDRGEREIEQCDALGVCQRAIQWIIGGRRSPRHTTKCMSANVQPIERHTATRTAGITRHPRPDQSMLPILVQHLPWGRQRMG